MRMAHLCELPTEATTMDWTCPQCGKWWSAQATPGGLTWKEVASGFGRPAPDLFGGQL